MDDGTVVNVTLPGHPLFPGYVVRTVKSTGGGAVVDNYGEGTGSLQKPGGTFAKGINGVWNGQTQDLIDKLPKKCGCTK
jgi:hypothetical protein